MVRFVSQHDSRSKQYNINGYTACKLQLDGREKYFVLPGVMAMMATGMIGVLSNGMDMMNHILPVYYVLIIVEPLSWW
jgi:hypothetical protein